MSAEISPTEQGNRAQLAMSHTAATKHVEEINLATARIESQDPGVVVQGLNVLTRKSFDALEANNVQFEHFPQLLISLGSVLDVINPLKDVAYCSGDLGSISVDQLSWQRWKSSVNSATKVSRTRAMLTTSKQE
jgi:hypothetical protein